MICLFWLHCKLYISKILFNYFPMLPITTAKTYFLCNLICKMLLSYQAYS